MRWRNALKEFGEMCVARGLRYNCQCDWNFLGYVDDVRVSRAGEFLVVVTAMGVPLGMGTHPLMSTSMAPVPPLAVGVVDSGEGFSASNFNGDGGVSFMGVLTLDAVGAAKGDTVSGSFVASWTHVPVVTGNVATGVRARPGSVAVSFSFVRS